MPELRKRIVLAGLGLQTLGAWLLTLPACADEAGLTNAEATASSTNAAEVQAWNWHAQGTFYLQGDPGFPAKYSGPNSLHSGGEIQDTISLDLYLGARLWRGAEAHVDGLMWQGFGLSQTLGVEGFPNGEAFRLGTSIPNVTFARVFIRQTIGLGGEQEKVEDDAFHLGGQQDVSRIVVTVGKFSTKDIFDNNAYANDPRTQFMNWAFMANEAWDYPADSIGFDTGLAIELYQPNWALRYGFFQMPRVSNGMAQDTHYLEAWGMVGEFERRFAICDHPGAVRLLGYLNSAHMGSYQEAVDNAISSGLPADIVATRRYSYKAGVGLNLEQEICTNIGVFSRIGWSDGRNEAWVFADVDRQASLGLSVKGAFWGRPDDTVGLAGALSGISREHRQFFELGGTGILAGDGALTYGIEKVMEVYYDFHIWKTVHGALDYQFISNPAYNRDRGPVSVIAGRLHFEL